MRYDAGRPRAVIRFKISQPRTISLPCPAAIRDSPLVFHRDGIPIRRWRTTWRTACQAAGVPTRFLHDCRRTAARNLIRASVPERVAMLLTGHKSRAIFDRYNIILGLIRSRGHVPKGGYDVPNGSNHTSAVTPAIQ